MPKYQLNKDHYLQDNKRDIPPKLHTKGSVVDWDGPPSLAMTPLDQSGKDAMASRAAARAAEQRQRKGKTRVGYTEAFARNFAAVQAQQHDADQPATADRKKPKPRARRTESAAAAA